MNRDFGAEAQAAAEAHLAACNEALYGEDLVMDGDPNYEAPDSPACAPFDGCDTCIVREVLYAAWQVLDDYIKDVVAELEAKVDELQLRDIEARNPGIDIEEVRRFRKTGRRDG